MCVSSFIFFNFNFNFNLFNFNWEILDPQLETLASMQKKSSNAERKLLNARIKWAEASGRHKDMLRAAKQLIQYASDQGLELTPDERNYVSFAYKNIVSELRLIWRTLVRTELTWLEEAGRAKPVAATATDAHMAFYMKIQKRNADAAEALAKAELKAKKFERNAVNNGAEGKTGGVDMPEDASGRGSRKSNRTKGEKANGDGRSDDEDEENKPLYLPDPRSEAELRAAWFAEYQGGVEQKLIEVCAELEETVKETLLPATGEPQGKVFFRKMLADYSRYLSEILDGSARRERAQAALMSYKLAATLADSVLRATDPVRLGLSLNFSVFYWEILGFKDRARHVAKAAFDDAMAELDTMEDSAYRESVLILELIRENLELWKKQDGEKLVTSGDF